MKYRTQFVANSSSTSFVVFENDLENCRKHGVKYDSVAELLETMESLPDFFEFYWIRDKLLKIKNAYITDSVDRDWAAEEGFDYGVFIGDL